MTDLKHCGHGKSTSEPCAVCEKLESMTAQAAAEANSLRAQLEEARRQLTEGRRLTEQVISERDSIKAQLAEMDAAFQARPTQAALTAAQGEVADLRALALSLRACSGACECDGCKRSYAKAIASTRATAAAHDERVRREALEALNQVLDILKTRGQVFDSAEYRCNHALTIGQNKADALAHPTKEPSK